MYGQIIPFEIDFINAEPAWIYFTTDTNYVEDPNLPTSASIFSNRLGVWIDDYEENLLIFEQHAGPYNGLSGFSLHCLDKYNGIEKYVLHDNVNNGLMYNEIYISDYHEIEDNKLQIFGYRSDVPHPNNYFVVFHGSPIIKEIDLISGKVINQQVGIPPNSPDLHTTFTPSNGKQFINSSNQHLHYLTGGEIIDSEAVNYTKFYMISDSLEIDSNSLNEIQFFTGIPTQSSLLTSPPIGSVCSDSIFMVINSVKNLPDLSQSPEDATISWWNISELNSLSRISEIDITDFFPKQEDPFKALSFKNFGNDVVLTQHIDEFDVQTGLEKYSWIAWFNKESGLVNSIEKFGDNFKNYSCINPILIKDDVLLFFAYRINNMEVSYDVFALSRDESEAQLVGSFSFEENPDITYSSFIEVHDTDDDFAIGYVKYRFKQEDGSFTNSLLYMAFDFSNILTSLSQNEFHLQENMYTIFPTPTEGKLQIDFGKPRIGEISILNLSGEIMLSIEVLLDTSLELNCSQLLNGNYIFRFEDESGNIQSRLFQKLY